MEIAAKDKKDSAVPKREALCSPWTYGWGWGAAKDKKDSAVPKLEAVSGKRLNDWKRPPAPTGKQCTRHGYSFPNKPN
ncbi:hypothetical protein CEXT_557481 [Caerostris extrusa]|uniref:Uncharacterized protein n=1 Tax=Caerostris extrusa TaxID=172846 RepID=A0AAV4T582_CAEEX|nr:hypothetical protein CEXT_557481 [Caerostris extrusa]